MSDRIDQRQLTNRQLARDLATFSNRPCRKPAERAKNKIARFLGDDLAMRARSQGSKTETPSTVLIRLNYDEPSRSFSHDDFFDGASKHFLHAFGQFALDNDLIFLFSL